jgi:hypothetical protein
MASRHSGSRQSVEAKATNPASQSVGPVRFVSWSSRLWVGRGSAAWARGASLKRHADVVTEIRQNLALGSVMSGLGVERVEWSTVELACPGCLPGNGSAGRLGDAMATSPSPCHLVPSVPVSCRFTALPVAYAGRRGVFVSVRTGSCTADPIRTPSLAPLEPVAILMPVSTGPQAAPANTL